MFESITPLQGSWVRAPPGLEHIGETIWGNISLANIMDSSIAHYYKHGLKDEEKKQLDEIQDKLFFLQNTSLKLGGEIPGIFTLLIANCPHRECISQVATENKDHKYEPRKTHEIMPCMVGDFSWTNHDYSREKDETRDFLQATSLFTEKFFKQRCKKIHNCQRDPVVAHHHWEFSTERSTICYPRSLDSTFGLADMSNSKAEVADGVYTIYSL
ncbi:hypothetical protein EJ08DRAFT_653320 [Tothia fuscella]|uniref:Uncharacterized protein n=1 Tax=Tothia fuscella TaxID=1048955 RepID=A0A9P4NHY1_9PEZI|nr:hypothetical protein EJ08DRAFT_653320 [Tothia fuscella]